MTKLLIVDDEPLVQIGIKSMLNWTDYGIEVCGTAMNGSIALDMIEEYSPELVITDIRMPIINGLELAKICQETYGKIPLFLILTSYEEFQLVKEAMSCQVIDYLVKLELDADSLAKSVQKALTRLDELKQAEVAHTSGRPLLQSYYDKFLMRLLYNLFEDQRQFDIQARDVGLEFRDQAYLAAHCSISESQPREMGKNQLLNLYNSSFQMVKEILIKYLPCYLISLDMKHFAVIFHAPELKEDSHKLLEAFSTARTMVHKYFSVRLTAGIGTVVDSPRGISDSYQEARQAASQAGETSPFYFFSQHNHNTDCKNSFNLSLFKSEFTKAFEEFDGEILHRCLTEMIGLFSTNPLRYLQAMDGACNMLYLALSLLPDGEETLSEIFAEVPDSYRAIYRASSMDQVIQWMEQFRKGLCENINTKRKTYKTHVITNVQNYIKNHVTERLTLNEVADVFGISPNYLSALFKKTCQTGFSEYISQVKVARAKNMLLEQNLKIYEVADMLGFESAFYFSKVFKKMEGISPREFIQEKTINPHPHD